MVLNLVKAANNMILFLIVFITPAFSITALESTFNNQALSSVKEDIPYSFVIGGHLYGTSKNMRSIFPASSLLANLNKINIPEVKFFISLGDIYRYANEINISTYKKYFCDKLQVPVFNAVGNHEMFDRSLYEQHFGKTYYSFRYYNDLFIMLDSELDGTNITGKQLTFFKFNIRQAQKDQQIKNVFIFSHKLIWGVGNPDFEIVSRHQNDQGNYPIKNNFKKEIEPYLIKLSKNKKVYWASGDIGCYDQFNLFFAKHDLSNIYYIATGMCDTEQDVLVRVNIDEGGKRVSFRPISLTGRKNLKMASYHVEYWEEFFQEQNRSIATNSAQIILKIVRMVRHKYYWVGVLSSFFLLGVIFLFRKKIHDFRFA